MIEGHGGDAYNYRGITMDFSSNIFPYADLSGLKTFLSTRFGMITRYPEPEAYSLEVMIGERYDRDAEEIIVTAGATDAIYLIAQTFAGATATIMSRPTFAEYEDACRLFHCPVVDRGGEVTWLCNPNNPTGEYLPELPEVESRLVVDMSYAGDSTLTGGHEIIEIHSFTKSRAVPGLRLGWIAAPAADARRIRRNMRPWAVSTLAIEAGKYLLHQPSVMTGAYLAEAGRLRRLLLAIPGISVLPTRTNFMLCRIESPARTAAQLKHYLASQHGMLIREAGNFASLTPCHFRVAARDRADDDALADAIRQWMEQA